MFADLLDEDRIHQNPEVNHFLLKQAVERFNKKIRPGKPEDVQIREVSRELVHYASSKRELKRSYLNF